MAIISSNQPQPDKEPQKRAKVNKPKAEATILRPQVQSSGEVQQEETLRPRTLAEYIGQKDLKQLLEIGMQAAKSRGESLDHLLLYGPPGLGKTTIALILAQEMGVNCKITAAPALERPRDIMGLLVNMAPGDVLFIDEIHRLTRMSEELLYSAMEDFRIDLTVGKGTSAKTRTIPLSKFTLVGATTKVGALTSPLRDRFGLIQRLKFYEVDELCAIAARTASILQARVSNDGATEIAKRARGTPRIVNRLLKRVRDFAQVKGYEQIDATVATEALELLQVDPMGLDWTDRLLLSTMINQFNSRPVGLEAIAASTGEDAQTIEEVYEPYLLQIGYLQRTPRGRIPTDKAKEHLGLTA